MQFKLLIALATIFFATSALHAKHDKKGHKERKGRGEKNSQTEDSAACPSACPICPDYGYYDYVEGIDVDSLTPEAQSKKLYEASQARLEFVLPDDAHIHLKGVLMSSLGEERSFLVPVESQKNDYKYEIQINVVRGGKLYFKKKEEIIRAGMILNIICRGSCRGNG